MDVQLAVSFCEDEIDSDSVRKLSNKRLRRAADTLWPLQMTRDRQVDDTLVMLAVSSEMGAVMSFTV